MVKPLQKQVHVIVSTYTYSICIFLLIHSLFGVYYRIYDEDGAICSKKPVNPDNPFLGRMKAKSVPPPHNVASVKCCIANFEGIKEDTPTSLFVTLYSKSPMGKADKVSILNRKGLGSMPKEYLVLVARLSPQQRKVLESDGRGEYVNAQSSVQSRECEVVSTVVKATTRYRAYTLSITFITTPVDILSVILSLLPTVHRTR